jgi:hypothetical protein
MGSSMRWGKSKGSRQMDSSKGVGERCSVEVEIEVGDTLFAG